MSYVHDGLGRISRKTETFGGVTDIFAYTYDLAGQVVTKNGTAVESYGYDANGNRISATVAGSSILASYDAQDRMTAYGTASFAYNAAGQLLTKTSGASTTSYQYDAVGNLTAATLPSGTAITYVVDGRERRVGRRVNGTPVQGLLYGDKLRPIAELDGTGALVSRFVYAGRNVPAYVVRGGVAHRIVTDTVGSVRLVVNATTGAIAQRIDYDTFGNVILDTNPGFQPFGFAGGIFDGDRPRAFRRARDYDPSTGRWTAKDPIGFAGADANLYSYVRNNPVNLVDPLGMGVQTDLESLISWLEATIADLRTPPTPSGGRGVVPYSTTEVSEYGRSLGERSVLREAYENELAESRRKLTAMKVNSRSRLSCGGLVRMASTAIGLLDFAVVYQRSQDSGRSFFDELDVQAADMNAEQANAGIHTTVTFFGPFVFVKGGGSSTGPSWDDFGSF